MKKFLSSLLIVVIVLTALTSCMLTTTSPADTTLSTGSGDVIQTTDPSGEITSSKETEKAPMSETNKNNFIYIPDVDVSTLKKYGVEVDYADSTFFNVSHDHRPNQDIRKEFKDPIKSTIKLGKYETEAYLRETCTFTDSWGNVSFYISEDINYKIYEDHNAWTIYSLEKTSPLARFSDSEITVETLEKHAHNYLSNYIDLDDIKGFKREVYTDVEILYTDKEAAHTSGLANGLLSANDELPPPFEDNQKIEKIRGYEIKYYIEFDNGFRTPDYITVLYRANGDIHQVRFRHDDMDEKSISFDRTSVDYCVQQWIERVKKDNVELIGWRYRYSAPKFQCEDERICAEVIICVKIGERDPFYDTIKLYISLRKYDEYGN